MGFYYSLYEWFNPVYRSDIKRFVDEHFFPQFKGCGPCKMVSPILDELATEYDGKIKIGKVNIDEHQALATQFGIRAIPTLLIFKNGQVVDQIVGLRSKKDFKGKLDRVLTS